MITIVQLLEIAQDLVSEDGENPEYDRALVELCVRAARLSHDQDDLIKSTVLKGQSGHNS